MKAVIRSTAFVRSVAIAVSLCVSGSVAAQSRKDIELNEIAFTFAMELIKQGAVIADGKGAWTKHRPSPDEENEFIRLRGFAQYGKWYLGIDSRFPENSKRRYKFPYGDFKNVHRCGLLAAKARARQYGYEEIGNAAAKLDAAVKESTIDRRGRVEHRPPGLCAQRSWTPLKFEQTVSNPLAAQAASLCSDLTRVNLWR